MRRHALTVACLLAGACPSLAGQKVTLMGDSALEAIRTRVSGATAKAHIIALSRMHRVHASEGFHQAAEYVRGEALRYGLENVEIVALPADGETRYHHFRAYYGWRAEEGSLWEVSPRRERIADYDEMRVALADYSQDAEVTSELVDVGSGTRDEDYRGKEVKGKIVLAGGPLPVVHREAVEERGAAGFVSYFPNQRTGWSGDDPTLVRWGHLDPYNTANRFAFMVSLGKARELQARLAAGETIRLSARVRARLAPGAFEVVTAVIGGSEIPDEEIVYTCHLDHQSPGANDNASGAAALLEVARALAELTRSGALARPRRTLRFVWPPEIAGTYAWLARHPEIAARLKAGIHMDMVGGIPQTNKSVFFLSRPPSSLGSFVGDVGEVFFDYVRETSRRAAASGDFREAIVSPEGTKEDWVAEVQGLDLGSDHEVLGDAFFGVPTLYFHDWPDVYIHTNKDRPEYMDATKLQRVAFLGAATGYTLAELGPTDAPAVAAESAGRAAERLGRDRARALGLLLRSEGEAVHEAFREARNLIEHGYRREVDALGSIARFTGAAPTVLEPLSKTLTPLRDAALAAAGALYGDLCRMRSLPPRRAAALEPSDGPEARRLPVRADPVKGPLSIYYFDYLASRLGPEEAGTDLDERIAYEIFNLADGKRTVRQIRDWVSAEFGPVPIAAVLAYLAKLERAEALSFREATSR